MEKRGSISQLNLQPRFRMVHNGVKICDYVADFSYQEGGEFVVEDYKGVLTPEYKLKKKMLLAFHGIEVRETGYADTKL